jgi:predicted transcriptional regulator
MEKLREISNETLHRLCRELEEREAEATSYFTKRVYSELLVEVKKEVDNRFTGDGKDEILAKALEKLLK